MRAPKRDAADDDEMQSLVIIKKTGSRWLARATDTPAIKIKPVRHSNYRSQVASPLYSMGGWDHKNEVIETDESIGGLRLESHRKKYR